MDKTIYFDNAATTFPKPEDVYIALNDSNRDFAVNAGRGSYKLAKEASAIIDITRVKISKLFNFSKEDHVIFSPSATIALNQIIGGLDFGGHKNVYVTPFEHNAVMRPLSHVNESKDINILEIPFDFQTLELNINQLKVDFSINYPDYVFLSHVSNVTGLILPISEIINLAKEYGAVVILDCCQSAGLIPIDLKNIAADFFVFAGHKTLYGPFGIGGFIYNSNIELKKYITGGTGSDSLNLDMPNSYPAKYEAASPNITAIAGLNAALNWINKTDIENIKLKEQKLTKYLIEGLKTIKGIKLYLPGDLQQHTSIVSCNFPNYSPDEIGMILDEDFNIAVRTGFHCAPKIHNLLGTRVLGGTVRFSVGYFNEIEHIEYLIKRLREI